jgi:hypothetical protein
MRNHSYTIAAIVLFACSLAPGQASQPATQAVEPEIRAFELTATAPPTPAMKYTLLFPFADRRPGNAAPLYADAVMLMGAGANETAQKALDAREAKDLKAFAKLADSLELKTMFDELDDAGRRMYCDWEPPIRERGALTLLPHLQQLRHGLGKVVRVRALRQIDQGKLDDALLTLRLGYEIANSITEPVLISALVAAGNVRWQNDVTAELMSHPQSPNLYWALVNLPTTQTVLRRAWYGESSWIYICSPTLGRYRAGESLSAEQWRRTMTDDLAPQRENYRATMHREPPDPVRDATPENLGAAREAYAVAHELTAEQAAKVDPAIVLGEWYFQTWRATNDEIARCNGLPYWEILPRASAHRDDMAKLSATQPANVFLGMLSDFSKIVLTFARTDRQLAGLTAVEAIRSYAAANGGKLPAQLEDVKDTPVPPNPMTGKPFEYHVEGDTATLSDPTAEAPMTYTIRIRK